MWDTLSLTEAILTLETEEECQHFLHDLLTPDEREMIANRWRAFCLMSVESPVQRKASDALGVSLKTVNTASKLLRSGTGSMRRVIHKLYQRRIPQ